MGRPVKSAISNNAIRRGQEDAHNGSTSGHAWDLEEALSRIDAETVGAALERIEALVQDFREARHGGDQDHDRPRDGAPPHKPEPTEPAPLPNGVSSGDVTADSVVLWVRSLATGKVTFKVYEVDEKGRERLVAQEKARVTDTDIPVKVTIDDLKPGRDYIYKVEDAAGAKAQGQFETAFEDGFHGLHFGVTGDWRGDLAPYPAIANVAAKALDFFVLEGDTIYGDFASPAGPPTTELDGYRAKYQEVYGVTAGENFFAELRASTATFQVIDDHEVINDFAGGAPASSDPRLMTSTGLVNDTPAYEAGLQAFQEYHAISDQRWGKTGDPRTAGEINLYRSQQFGQDAQIYILDQRSFRDEQIADVANLTDVAEIARFLTESLDPSRTLLGDAQLEALKADLLAAEKNGVTWKFIHTPEPFQALGIYNADSWDGYQAERNEILKFIEANDIDNVVFVAADIHATFVNNITYAERPFGPQIATSTWEITTGSVGFSPAFGTSVVQVAQATGLLSAQQVAFYNSLPIAPDNDGNPFNDKDGFVTNAFNNLTLIPAGLDPLGLDNNLPQANGLIDATLLQGGWVSAHTFGWTEFEIDAKTQALTVTTWGIPAYTPDQAANDPAAVLALTPSIVSQFRVEAERPDDNIIQATAKREVLKGTQAVDVFVFEKGDSTAAKTDLIRDFAAGDKIDLIAFGFVDVKIRGDAVSCDYDDGVVTITGGKGTDRLVLRVEGELEDVRAGLLLSPADSLI